MKEALYFDHDPSRLDIRKPAGRGMKPATWKLRIKKSVFCESSASSNSAIYSKAIILRGFTPTVDNIRAALADAGEEADERCESIRQQYLRGFLPGEVFSIDLRAPADVSAVAHFDKLDI